jgi:AraC-like DNA-binding protein
MTETDKLEAQWEWVQGLQKTIHAKLQEGDLPMDDLARLAGMNRTKFFTKVKKYTGMTPAVLVRNIRLDKAYEYLASNPSASVVTAAHNAGMTDVKNFSTLFKKRFGVSPRAVKKLGRQKLDPTRITNPTQNPKS